MILEDIVLDEGLTAAQAGIASITLCASEPTTFTLASDGNANCLAIKTFGEGSAFTGPVAGTLASRKLVSEAVADGTIKTSGTASWWAAIGTASLYAHGPLPIPTVLVSSNKFVTGNFEIRIAGNE